MAEALKDTNRTPLLLMALANAALFYLAVQTNSLVAGDWLELLRGWSEAVPAGGGLLLVGILNAQLDSNAKARLVFWRWRNPLPGSRAFSKYGPADSRIDMDAIRKAHGPLPSDPAQQNTTWYRLYKTVEDHPSVLEAHRQFLFTRDASCMLLVLLLTLAPAGFVLIPTTKTAVAYAVVLLAEYALVTRAARVHGARFVTTTLALKGAGR